MPLSRPSFAPAVALTRRERAPFGLRAVDGRDVADALADASLIAVSEIMRAVRASLERLATSDEPVVIVGEAGTGKEFAARLLHARSGRPGPFVVVDCSRLGERELATELFGGGGSQQKGALAMAEGGTLFLRKLAAASLPLQLRMLTANAEARRANAALARLVIAAHPEGVGRRAGDIDARTSPKLRFDLYRQHRASVIDLPSLRARRPDIVPLARHFLEQARSTPLSFAPDVESALAAHSWPGNVAELRRLVGDAVRQTNGEVITREAFPRLSRSSASELVAELAFLPYREMLAASRERLSREYFTHLLTTLDGNVAAAARHAGVERESLHRILKHLGIRADDFRSE